MQLFELLYHEWVKESVNFIDIDKLLTGLFKGKLVYITDSSFFLEKSHLIVAVWIASVDNVIVARSNFVSSVPLKYTHPFTAEICRVLAIIVVVDYLLMKYPNLA